MRADRPSGKAPDARAVVEKAVQGAFADDALREKLASEIRREDAGLATDLTLGVLRWQRLLDFLIDRKLSSAKKSLDDEVRIALRLGVYQLWFHARVPARAARIPIQLRLRQG